MLFNTNPYNLNVILHNPLLIINNSNLLLLIKIIQFLLLVRVQEVLVLFNQSFLLFKIAVIFKYLLTIFQASYV